jgi:hypothetical protein
LLALAAALATPCARAQTAPGAPTQVPQAQLLQRLDQLAAEIAQIKAQLASGTTSAMPANAVPTTPSTPPVASNSPGLALPAAREPATVLTSYGEANYVRTPGQPSATQADLRRLVLGFAHRFDDKTRLVTEIEVEHAVSSSGDAGEVAIEQAYIEHQLTPTWSLRGGLFLMPMGLLNENHEPTAFLGVERNLVETAIIPSTWREGGLMAVGNFDNGISVQAALSTSFNLGKWDATSNEGRESPLGAVHQEMSLASARDLALTAAINWRGVPGLQLGASVFSGGSGQGLTSHSARITLWDVHARWTPDRWDLSALISRGHISNTGLLNASLAGSTSLIPATFDGAYVQAGYRLWQRGAYQLTPFVRWEQANTGRRYAELGQGLTPDALPTQQVITLGANFDFAPGVVLKADWQRLKNADAAHRVRLGLGWSF